MKKVIILISGIIAVGVAYWLISPLFITRKVNEKLENIAPPTTQVTPPASTQVEKLPLESPPESPIIVEIARGTFTGLAGHSGKGTTVLLTIGGKKYLRFEDDFRVTNGPDLFVYFGKDGNYAAEARLGALKGNEGGQNYEVPAGIDANKYSEVWVWCRAFSVPFAKAELR